MVALMVEKKNNTKVIIIAFAFYKKNSKKLGDNTYDDKG